MKSCNSFNNRQYQLPVSRNTKDKHRSLKSRKVNDLFVGKIAYNPMLFRNTGRNPMKTGREIRISFKH